MSWRATFATLTAPSIQLQWRTQGAGLVTGVALLEGIPHEGTVVSGSIALQPICRGFMYPVPDDFVGSDAPQHTIRLANVQ